STALSSSSNFLAASRFVPSSPAYILSSSATFPQRFPSFASVVAQAPEEAVFALPAFQAAAPSIHERDQTFHAVQKRAATALQRLTGHRRVAAVNHAVILFECEAIHQTGWPSFE